MMAAPANPELRKKQEVFKRLKAVDPEGAARLNQRSMAGANVTVEEIEAAIRGAEQQNQHKPGVPEGAPRAKPSQPIKWFDALFEHPGLTVSDVAVGSYLWLRAGKTMACWPTQESIAKGCRIRRQTVSAVLTKLARLGMIESRQRRRSRDGRVTSQSNKYRLLPPEGWKVATPGGEGMVL